MLFFFFLFRFSLLCLRLCFLNFLFTFLRVFFPIFVFFIQLKLILHFFTLTIWNFLRVLNFLNVFSFLNFDFFPSDSAGEMHILRHDGDSLGLLGAEFGIFEEPD